jgi:hypothetical protein
MLMDDEDDDDDDDDDGDVDIEFSSEIGSLIFSSVVCSDDGG